MRTCTHLPSRARDKTLVTGLADRTLVLVRQNSFMVSTEGPQSSSGEALTRRDMMLIRENLTRANLSAWSSGMRKLVRVLASRMPRIIY